MKVLKLKKVTPMYTKIVTSAERYSEGTFVPGTSILDPTKIKKSLKEYQRVVAIGNMVTNIKIGDLVCINPSRYAVRKQVPTMKDEMSEHYTYNTISYNFNILEINGSECLLIDQQDIDFIVNDFTEEEEVINDIKETNKNSSLILS